MRRIELELEHRYKNRFLGRHRIRSGRVTTIGSARDAHIRLLGEDVGGIHATLEVAEKGWLLSDMGTENGTWVQKNPVIEQAITEETVIQIGGHQLTVIPREIDTTLFTEKAQKPSQQKGQLFHQVVIMSKDKVVRTEILHPKQDFNFKFGNKVMRLRAPTGPDWVKTDHGPEVVLQRLVNSQQLREEMGDRLKGLLDPEMRGPVLTAIIMLLMVVGFAVLLPQKPTDELVEIKDNRYTKIIYDAKKIRKEKQKSQELRKNIAGKTDVGRVNPQATGTPKVGPTAAELSKSAGTKVLNNIKAAGLGALIGKISKRAAQNVAVIAAQGRAPDSAATGPALGIAGGASLEKAGVKGNIGGGESKSIGGVGTIGKGGGSSAYKGIGGLAMGNVGNASVGILDEETEVEGGLDKEVIARIIKSQLGQIRYCYERQLSANPDLYGKVQIRFTIGAGGTVVSQAVGSTSLNSAMVEGCILRRVAGWQFPKPNGGTSVIVTYPFLFKSTR